MACDIKWIKITTDIFDDEKMKLIDTMPDRDALIVIWFKLLALTGKKNESGLLFLSPKMAYTDEMLATIFNRPLNTVRLALETFQNFDMIEIAENNVISVVNWEKHQNVEGMDKIREQNKVRQRNKRTRQKLLLGLTEETECVYCGKKASGFDHIIPTSKGGLDIMDNKVPCCKSCNTKKNNRPLVDFLNNNKDLIIKDSVVNNETMKNFIKYENGEFVTLHVTLCNAIEEDKEKEEDKNKIRIRINIPFDTFWEQYDYKKSSKTKCESKWNKLKDQDRESIIEYIPGYKESTPDKQYRKHPLTFLNNDGWLEEIVSKKSNNSKPSDIKEFKRTEYTQDEEYALPGRE